MLVDGIWLMLLGVLAVPNLILSKRPDAKQVLDKLAPYQGWIGAVSAIWGLFRIISLLRSFALLKLGVGGIIAFVVYAVFVVTQIVLGFILGIGVMKSFVKDANAQAKMDNLLSKVLPFQVTLGLAAIIDGIALLVIGIKPDILF